MDMIPRLFHGTVMHKRFTPKSNHFVYKVYYVLLPLPAKDTPGPLAFFDPKDVGFRDGRDPGLWAMEILEKYDMREKVHQLALLTMPRVLGYVFNPVSFYLGFNQKGALCCVIAEVHNTFGEQHSYLCHHADGRPIDKDETLHGQKCFHVSPFLEREGSYAFRFDVRDDGLFIGIDYLTETGEKRLSTVLTGTFGPLSSWTLVKAFFKVPFLSMKTTFLIHWQALKLYVKGLAYVPKPKPLNEKTTVVKQKDKKLL